MYRVAMCVLSVERFRNRLEERAARLNVSQYPFLMCTM
jgi:hypothetical protein